MTWEELYPIVKDQAYYAVFRYDVRRADKISELIAMCLVKYQHDIAVGKEIRKQDYKMFVTQRAKSLDIRSVVKGGGGGTSTIDVLGYYRQRPDSSTPVVAFDDWMTFSTRSKQLVDEAVSFHMDYKLWLAQLNKQQQQILDYLIQGYKASKIAELINCAYSFVRQAIKEIQKLFVRFFKIGVCNA